MVRILLIPICLVAAAGAGFCQSSYSVAGVVYDPSGAGVQGARVALERGAAIVQQTTSTLTGDFRFDAVAPGAYQIKVDRDGFKPQTARLQAGPRTSAPVRISLAVADVRQEITINAEA